MANALTLEQAAAKLIHGGPPYLCTETEWHGPGTICVECDNATVALAQAHAEGQGALRAVVENLLDVMEMQEKRESGAFHITGEVMWGIWSDAKTNARAALAGQPSGDTK